MIKKKSQITIFLIIIVVLAILAVFVFYFYKTTKIPNEKPENLNFDTFSLENSIKECMKITLLDALVVVAQQGGYYDKPNTNVFLDDFSFLPYYAIYGQPSIPALSTIETEISKYVDAFLENCTLDAFQVYPYLRITSRPPSSKTTATDQDIILNLNYPLTVKNNEVTKEMDTFMIRVPDIKLKKVYTAIEKTKDSYLPSEICTSCLRDIGEEFEVFFYLKETNQSSFIITVTDYNSTYYGEPYSFMYTVKLQPPQEVVQNE